MSYLNLSKHIKIVILPLLALLIVMFAVAVPGHAAADPCKAGDNGTPAHCCGSGGDQAQIAISVDIGCKSKGNPIMDATFGIIRFLSVGVGIILVGSMVYAGIQYTMSRGDPQATAQAVTRIRTNVWALLLFIFSFAILNYLIPGAFLK